MGVVIYRNTDSKIMLEFLQWPLYQTDIFENFINTNGFKKEDYTEVRLTQLQVYEGFLREIKIVDDKVVFGEEKIIEEPQKEPTEKEKIEKLQQENNLLKAQNQALSDKT